MLRPYLPLNNFRAFEAAARHLSFTKAAIELRVTPAALSHQVKALEDRIGTPLFHRLPRGLSLTDDGRAMLPVLEDAFDRIALLVERYELRESREIVNVGAVGTFAVAWLLPRLGQFEADNPGIGIRLSTNNNRVDIAEEGLDFAVKFGDGAWHGIEAKLLFEPAFTPLCDAPTAERLTEPRDLLSERLLRSYRDDDWPLWFKAAGLERPMLRGPVFDSSLAMVEAAARGFGVALAPAPMFDADLDSGRIVRPFAIDVSLGCYWLTQLKSRSRSEGMIAFERWLLEAAAMEQGALPAQE